MSSQPGAVASVLELIKLLDQRKISAREVLDHYLERIDRLDGPINAIATLAPERAQQEAAAVDAARATGRGVGALAGIPITVKDAIATADIRSTGGATELADHVPQCDAEAVARLRSAGAVVFGKTNLPRWSGDFQTYNEIFGTTNNPWDLERTPGGSSGGAAAAVAMGFSAFELGTDIGGSIRVPASFCGVYGHKPSFGIIPTDGYLDHITHHHNQADVNVFGPIARTAADLSFLFDLLVAPPAVDAVAWRLDLPKPRATDLADFRVVAWLDDDFCRVDPAVRETLETTIDQLERAGARIDRNRRPYLDAAKASSDGLRLIMAATDISQPDLDFQHAAAAGTALLHRDWDLLHRERHQTRRAWADFFADVDVLLCPVTPVPPFRHVQSSAGSNWTHSVLGDYGGRIYDDLVGWTALIGSQYLPVTTAPAGVSGRGLPIGVQVVAPYLHDQTALAFARAMASVFGDPPAPPAAMT